MEGFLKNYAETPKDEPRLPKETSKWFVGKTDQNIFYTPFHKSARIRKHIAEGIGAPNPKDIVSTLNQADAEGRDVYFEDGIIYETIEDGKYNDEVILPGGCYNHYGRDHDVPERLEPFELRTDGFIPTKDFDKVKEHVGNFLNSESTIRSGGAIYKTGLLLYGPPGNSKTSSVRYLINSGFLPHDVIVIYVRGGMSTSFIKKIKNSLPNRLKVFVFEEIVTMTTNDGKVEWLLNFLDGENSIDRSISIASTNYPEKLPSNIVDRPGRFDEIYRFDNPDEDDTKKIMSFYLGREALPNEVAACKGSSAATIQQTVIFSKTKNISIEDAVKTFKKRKEVVKNDFSKPRSMGIGSSIDDND